MDPKTAYEQSDSVVFLDVRTDVEYEAGHIDGSVHIPLQQLPERRDELDPGRSYVAVCHVGQRSQLAASFLAAHGFEAENLDGGLESWTAAGLPVVGEVKEGRAQYLQW
jgi:rhodanese-related sulfurtransferase